MKYAYSTGITLDVEDGIELDRAIDIWQTAWGSVPAEHRDICLTYWLDRNPGGLTVHLSNLEGGTNGRIIPETSDIYLRATRTHDEIGNDIPEDVLIDLFAYAYVATVTGDAAMETAQELGMLRSILGDRGDMWRDWVLDQPEILA